MNNLNLTRLSRFFWLYGLSIILITSCQSNEKSTLSPQVDRVLDLTYQYLYKDLFKNPRIDSLQLNQLHREYDDFWPIYVEHILHFGSSKDPAQILYLNNFIQAPEVTTLNQKTSEHFSQTSTYEEKLNLAFSKYKILWNDKLPIPQIIFYPSGFTYHQGHISPRKVVVTTKTLGISLDMYLGNEEPVYKEYGFPLYFRETMSHEYLVSDALRAWTYTEFDSLFTMKPGTQFIDLLLNHGKLLYFLSSIQENGFDTYVIGFPKNKFDWCVENEKQMWAQLIKDNLLFSNDPSKIEPYFTEGPFTSGFPKESPAKAVLYIAYKIVEKYHAQNTALSAWELLRTNNKQLFKHSNYKPAL